MTDEALKLQRFKEAVSADIEEQVSQILDEAQAECDRMMSMTRHTVTASEEKSRQRLRQEAELDYTRKLSTARLEAQRSVLVKREQLADKVFDRVREKLSAFRSSEGYLRYLEGAVKKCRERFPDKKPLLKLAPEDMKYAGKLGLEAAEDRNIVLGGVTVGFEGLGAVIDCTFDSMLENERAEFCNNKELSAL